MATLLLVDDDADLSVSLSSYLLAKGHQVVCESRGEDALRRAETESFDLVLLDLGLGRLDGMTVLTRIRQSDPALPVVMMTGNARISTAVEAIKLGAHDYIPKPFAMDQLLHVINRTIQESSLSREVEAMRYRLREAKRETSVLGDSAALRAVLDQIRKVAPTDLTVVLQ
jgi:DNA-binding NtrC family response regulator